MIKKKDGEFSPVHHLFVTVVEIPVSQLMHNML